MLRCLRCVVGRVFAQGRVTHGVMHTRAIVLVQARDSDDGSDASSDDSDSGSSSDADHKKKKRKKKKKHKKKKALHRSRVPPAPCPVLQPRTPSLSAAWLLPLAYVERGSPSAAALSTTCRRLLFAVLPSWVHQKKHKKKHKKKRQKKESDGKESGGFRMSDFWGGVDQAPDSSFYGTRDE